MADRRECKVCRDMQERKHKYDIVWKIIAVVSTILAIVFICLYFTSGDVVKETTINNEVEVTNQGGAATNENIGNVSSFEEKKSGDTTAIIVVIILAVIVVLGGICGAYIISSSRHKQSRANYEHLGRHEEGNGEEER